MIRPAAQTMRGFTLVELLVALALLGMVMLGISGAIRSYAQAEERVVGRIAREEQVRTVDDFLRQILSWVPLKNQSGLEKTVPGQVSFHGSANELIWIGCMPPRYGAGGTYWFRLFVAQNASGPYLALAYVPFVSPNNLVDWSSVEARELVPKLKTVNFLYLEREGAEWVDAWNDEKKIPETLSLNIESEQARWPALVVGIRKGHTVGQGANGSGKIVSGPGD